ncbi:MAG: hypothetical protein NC082_02485 [Clostridiales bacterium]|nr:hypothetical protein [Clostridiales bacterium]
MNRIYLFMILIWGLAACSGSPGVTSVKSEQECPDDTLIVDHLDGNVSCNEVESLFAMELPSGAEADFVAVYKNRMFMSYTMREGCDTLMEVIGGDTIFDKVAYKVFLLDINMNNNHIDTVVITRKDICDKFAEMSYYDSRRVELSGSQLMYMDSDSLNVQFNLSYPDTDVIEFFQYIKSASVDSVSCVSDLYYVNGVLCGLE